MYSSLVHILTQSARCVPNGDAWVILDIFFSRLHFDFFFSHGVMCVSARGQTVVWLKLMVYPLLNAFGFFFTSTETRSTRVNSIRVSLECRWRIGRKITIFECLPNAMQLIMRWETCKCMVDKTEGRGIA